MSLEIYKPIFIIGCGRSGTTMFQNMFSYHPELAWFSTLTNLFPRAPQLARFSRLLDITVLSPLVGQRSKISIRPSEAHRIWRRCFSEFPVPGRPLTDRDVTEECKRRIDNTVLSHLIHQKKKRFVTKYTGWSRIGYLNEIFPDSLFIHILRDGRAVVSSHLQKKWWPAPNEIEKWQSQRWRREWLKEYEESHCSPIVLAAIIWKLVTEEIRKSANIVGKNRFIEVRYEEIVTEPIETMKGVTNFCELEWKQDFESRLKSFSLQNRNYKWKKFLTAEEKGLLCPVLDDHLTRLGYL